MLEISVAQAATSSVVLPALQPLMTRISPDLAFSVGSRGTDHRPPRARRSALAGAQFSSRRAKPSSSQRFSFVNMIEVSSGMPLMQP